MSWLLYNVVRQYVDCVVFVCMCVDITYGLNIYLLSLFSPSQDPAGIFDLIEVVGNGTYGQVYKVSIVCCVVLVCATTLKRTVLPSNERLL